MTTTNTFMLRLAALAAGLGIVAMSFASIPAPAHAQSTGTTADMQAQIASLQSQIASLMAQLGGTMTTTFTRDLTIGSTGADVTELQTWLIGKGFSIPAGATGYFGTQTRAALAAYQASKGIVPAAGYFGPITRGNVNALIGAGTGTTTGGGTTTGALQGGSGTLSNVDTLGDVESDLHEGDSVTKVIGFEATAKDSDIAVQRLDVEFDISGTTGSANIDRYVDSVAVYQDGKKLASLDGSAGDKNGRDWTFRFSDLNGVIREGDTSDFYVEVTPVSGIGSTEDGVTVTASFPTDAIRANDAENVSETYTPSGDSTNDFTVSSATNGNLSLSEASDNPDTTVVKGDTSNTTDGVTLLSFNLKAKNQDVTLNDLPVGLTVTGTSNVGDVIQNVALMQGSKTLETKTVTSSGSSAQVVFDNLSNQVINSGDSQNYTVVATVRKLGTGSSGTSFDAGDTIVATTSASAAWDAEDRNGNTVNPTGSVTGGVVTFQTTGITVTKTDASYTKTVGQNAGEGDQTQYSISFKVTAGDDDLYIDRSIQKTLNPSVAGGGIAWATTTSSNANVTNAGVTNFSAADSNSGDTGTSFKIPSGTTRTFTLNVTLTATATGFTGVQLTGINYDTDSNTNDSALYYTANLDTFKTADVSMSTH